MTAIDDIRDELALLDHWEERYRYIIELGQALPPLSAEQKTSQNQISGCTSQVWLDYEVCYNEQGEKKLHFWVDSDAFIVKGLAALLLIIYQDQSPDFILSFSGQDILQKLGFAEKLSPNRRNGFVAIASHIHHIARQEADKQEVAKTQ